MTSFFVRRRGAGEGGADYVLQPGQNLVTGEADFRAQFGSITSLESDLLLIASSVFAADRAVPREEGEDLCRELVLNLPVVNSARIAPIINSLELVLYNMSKDIWHLQLRDERGEPELSFELPDICGSSLLFSGGLDSLSAAIELPMQGEPIELITHNSGNPRLGQTQRKLIQILNESGKGLPARTFRISLNSRPPANLNHNAELSQRTRSIVYLVLAALSARRSGYRERIYVAENGQLAVHLLLTQGRLSALTTHTADPNVLDGIQTVLSAALEIDLPIYNPYVYRTKAEIAKVTIDNLPDALAVSNSCWRAGRLTSGSTHCGQCIPCIIRRIAIEYHGADPTTYQQNLFAEDFNLLDENDIGRRNIADLAEFVWRMQNSNNEEIMSEWPALYSSNVDAQQAIDMYDRSANEARTVLSRYPGLAPLLQ